MYLSTRISRLCKRSPFLSLSLSLYISVCVLDWYFRACSVCVEGGGWRDYSPPGFQNYFLFPLFTYFFLFFGDIPPPWNSYKAAPISSLPLMRIIKDSTNKRKIKEYLLGYILHNNTLRFF